MRQKLDLEFFICPVTKTALSQDGDTLVNQDQSNSFVINDKGIPLFAEEFCSDDAKSQADHYNKVAELYVENLAYPHTIQYMEYLDKCLIQAISRYNAGSLGNVAEICCGKGEAVILLGDKMEHAVAVDISTVMLNYAVSEQEGNNKITFVQGDATTLPLATSMFDTAVMLGGIHHVGDRENLFKEVSRILKPGGLFIYREPVSDFFLWRLIRYFIYRISNALDHNTECPLLYAETVPLLEKQGMKSLEWRTYGFIGFCFFMNSDILVFNRLFKHIPKIRSITQMFAKFDDFLGHFSWLKKLGLQVIGIAIKK